LLIRALTYKDKSWGTESVDNQRRAEILLQELLSKYPNSNKISDAAYHLGDLYEKRRTRCIAGPRLISNAASNGTKHDARRPLRAARLYDKQTLDAPRHGTLP